jgi:sugar phosphate permease
MFSLLKPAPEAERLPVDRIDPEYRRLRRQVFAGIFAGYAGYYLVRNTLALAIPDLPRYRVSFRYLMRWGWSASTPSRRLRSAS